MKRDRSEQLYARARRSLAGGVSSQFRAQKPFPLFFAGADRARVVDVDGNAYLDFTLSQGPILLGHRHPRIDQAIQEALGRGILYAGQHELECQVAERVCRQIPGAELVRFGSSGSEMIQAALRAARYATGRDRFLKFEGHYHGWFDNVAVSIKPGKDEAGPHHAPRAAPWTGGQATASLSEAVVAPFNQREIVARLIAEHRDELAAVVLEPIMCNNGCIPAELEFLPWLREECTARGIVLIFDEIITGFRMGLGGAQAHFGVTPDLSVFGKGMGAGLPIAMLVGKERFMAPVGEGKCIHAGTYNSNTLGMAAAFATLQVLEEVGVAPLFALGSRLMEGLQTIARDAGWPVLVQGPGPMFHMAFTERNAIREYRDLWACDEALYGTFAARMLDAGVRLIPRGLWYVSLAHAEADVDLALEAAGRVLKELAPGRRPQTGPEGLPA